MDEAPRNRSLETRMGSPGLLQERRSICLCHAVVIVFQGEAAPETTTRTEYGSLESVTGTQQVNCTGKSHEASNILAPNASGITQGQRGYLSYSPLPGGEIHHRRRCKFTRMPVCLLNQKSWVFQVFEGSSKVKRNFCRARSTSLCISLREICRTQLKSASAAGVGISLE
jgi:hypothetical protein